MKLNENGVFIDGFEDIQIGKSFLLNVRVRVGENQGSWGYVISWDSNMAGHSEGLTPRDIKFSSRLEAIKRAREKVLNLSVVKNEFTDKMIEEIYEKLGETQLELF